MIEENSKYKVSLGWLREQQRKAKEDGFDNLHKWKCYKVLENKYGKEFAVWAIHNKGKIPGYILNAGCKDNKEYRNKLAKDNGFKNRAERMREWRYETGIRSPILENKDCIKTGRKFWKRDHFWITNKPELLKELEKYLSYR